MQNCSTFSFWYLRIVTGEKIVLIIVVQVAKVWIWTVIGDSIGAKAVYLTHLVPISTLVPHPFLKSKPPISRTTLKVCPKSRPWVTQSTATPNCGFGLMDTIILQGLRIGKKSNSWLKMLPMPFTMFTTPFLTQSIQLIFVSTKNSHCSTWILNFVINHYRSGCWSLWWLVQGKFRLPICFHYRIERYRILRIRIACKSNHWEWRRTLCWNESCFQQNHPRR